MDGVSAQQLALSSELEGTGIGNRDLQLARDSVVTFSGAAWTFPTGELLVSGVPTTADSVANKAYVDAGHEIFAVLPGRTGGQVLSGGTDASETLRLSSTSNATKGEVIFEDNLRMDGDNSFLPAVDGKGIIGNSTYKFKSIHANEVLTGDLVMRDESRNASWRFIEHHDHIEVVNEITGLSFELVLKKKRKVGLFKSLWDSIRQWFDYFRKPILDTTHGQVATQSGKKQ